MFALSDLSEMFQNPVNYKFRYASSLDGMVEAYPMYAERKFDEQGTMETDSKL